MQLVLKEARIGQSHYMNWMSNCSVVKIASCRK